MCGNDVLWQTLQKDHAGKGVTEAWNDLLPLCLPLIVALKTVMYCVLSSLRIPLSSNMDDCAWVVQDGSGAVKLSFISHISDLSVLWARREGFLGGWYIIMLTDYYKGTVSNRLDGKYDLPIMISRMGSQVLHPIDVLSRKTVSDSLFIGNMH